MAPAQLARAGAAEAEHEAMLDHQPLHLVQELGDLLDLVDEHEGRPGRERQQLLPEALRIPGETDEIAAFQEIETKGSGETFEQEGGLAGLAGTPQEKCVLDVRRDGQAAVKHATQSRSALLIIKDITFVYLDKPKWLFRFLLGAR